MKKTPGLALALLVGAAGHAAEAPGTPAAPAAAQPAENYPLTAFAAIGSAFAESSRLQELGWNEEQSAAFLDGVRAALRGRGFPFDETAQQVSAAMGRRLQENEARKKQSATELLAQPERLAKAMKEVRKRFGMQQADSGLAYNIQAGRQGVRPRPGDTVVITYEARAIDGQTPLPQLSRDHVTVELAGLLPGFMEGIQMMTIDGRGIFLVPPALSFGAGAWPEGVARGLPLLFTVTLHDVISATPPSS